VKIFFFPTSYRARGSALISFSISAFNIYADTLSTLQSGAASPNAAIREVHCRKPLAGILFSRPLRERGREGKRKRERKRERERERERERAADASGCRKQKPSKSGTFPHDAFFLWAFLGCVRPFGSIRSKPRSLVRGSSLASVLKTHLSGSHGSMSVGASRPGYPFQTIP